MPPIMKWDCQGGMTTIKLFAVAFMVLVLLCLHGLRHLVLIVLTSVGLQHVSLPGLL